MSKLRVIHAHGKSIIFGHIQNRINIRWQKVPASLFLVVWTLPYYQIKGINGNYTANIIQEATPIFQRLFQKVIAINFLMNF